MAESSDSTSDSASPPFDMDSIPAQIGSYKILEPLGQGGMGAVYVAEQSHPHRRVALKLIRPDCMSGATLRRFATESEVLGRLKHPGIAQIYEAGTAPTTSGLQPFFAMELIDGVTLDEYVKRHRSGVRDILTLVFKITQAVEHAHRHGIIHRDLKPTNILVEASAEPRILDFGLARIISGESLEASAETQLGSVVGTIPYMSPEQTWGTSKNLDGRSDVYSLGVVAFELLVKRLPYDLAGRAPLDALQIIREQQAASLGRIDKRLDGDLDTVIHKALAKDRRDRYQSAEAFGEDLNRVINARPILAASPTLWSRIRHWALQEERIRQAGLANIVIYLSVAVFELFWVLVGVVALLGVPVVGDLGSWGSFIAQCVLWAVVTGVLAAVNSRVMQQRVWAMWAALAGSVGLLVFTTLVLSNFIPYEMGGALTVGSRVMLFSLFEPLAIVMVLISTVALTTFYARRRWTNSDEPIRTERRPVADSGETTRQAR